MAEDDVTDVFLAAAAFIEIFGSDTDTDDITPHYVVCFRCAMSTIEHFRINTTLYVLSHYLVGLGPEVYL